MESIANHAFIASIAMLAHALFMLPEHFRQRAIAYGSYHALSNILHFLEKKLNRSSRTNEERDMRGSIVTGIVLLTALLAGSLLSALIPNNAFGILVEIIVVMSCLNLRQSVIYSLKVKEYVEQDDIAAARQCFVGSSYRSYSLLDAYGLIRASVERVIVDACTKLVAPILFYTVFGVTGLFACVAVVLLAECYTPFKEHFGRIALEIERWVLWIPARLTAFFYILATACLPIGRPFKAVWVLLSESLKMYPRHLLINVGAVLFGISLGGPLSPHIETREWQGGGTAQPTTSIIPKVALVTAFATLILLLLELALAF